MQITTDLPETLFSIGNRVFNLWNPLLDGERSAELPIALWFVSEFPDFIELGSVLPENGIAGHTCYDLFDKRKGVVNVDGEDVDMGGKTMLSISTIEHFGRKEYGNENIDPGKAARVLDKAVQMCRKYLITIPIGYNTDLDAHINEKYLGSKMIARKGEIGWQEVEPNVYKYPYEGVPRCATAVLIISNVI